MSCLFLSFTLLRELCCLVFTLKQRVCCEDSVTGDGWWLGWNIVLPLCLGSVHLIHLFIWRSCLCACVPPHILVLDHALCMRSQTQTCITAGLHPPQTMMTSDEHFCSACASTKMSWIFFTHWGLHLATNLQLFSISLHDVIQSWPPACHTVRCATAFY